jgi:hypothetical protein
MDVPIGNVFVLPDIMTFTERIYGESAAFVVKRFSKTFILSFSL